MASVFRHVEVRLGAAAFGVAAAAALAVTLAIPGEVPGDPSFKFASNHPEVFAVARGNATGAATETASIGAADRASTPEFAMADAGLEIPDDGLVTSGNGDEVHRDDASANGAQTQVGRAPYDAAPRALGGASGGASTSFGGSGGGGAASSSAAPSIGGGSGGASGGAATGGNGGSDGGTPLAGPGGGSGGDGGGSGGGNPPEEPETDVASSGGGGQGSGGLVAGNGNPNVGNTPGAGNAPNGGSSPNGSNGPSGDGPVAGTIPSGDSDVPVPVGTPAPIVIADLYSPGHSPGLDVYVDDPTTPGVDEGHLVLDGILKIEIGGLERGTEYDAIDAETVTLGGTLEVVLIAWPDGGPIFEPSAGNAFDIIIADVIIGDFAVFDFPLLAGGLFWMHEILPIAGAAGQGQFAYRLTVGQELSILQVAEVPEPGALIVFVLGAAALILRRRRTV
jgi:hypothetical protein